MRKLIVILTAMLAVAVAPALYAQDSGAGGGEGSNSEVVGEIIIEQSTEVAQSDEEVEEDEEPECD